MATFTQFIVGLGLIILLAIAAITFTLNMIGLNDPTSSTLSDPTVNATYNSLKERAAEIKSVSTTSKNLVEQAQPDPVFFFLIVKAAFTIPKSLLSFFVGGITTVLTLIFSPLFGGGNNDFGLIFDVVGALLVITFIILIIQKWRNG